RRLPDVADLDIIVEVVAVDRGGVGVLRGELRVRGQSLRPDLPVVGRSVYPVERGALNARELHRDDGARLRGERREARARQETAEQDPISVLAHHDTLAVCDRSVQYWCRMLQAPCTVAGIACKSVACPRMGVGFCQRGAARCKRSRRELRHSWSVGETLTTS